MESLIYGVGLTITVLTSVVVVPAVIFVSACSHLNEMIKEENKNKMDDICNELADKIEEEEANYTHLYKIPPPVNVSPKGYH